MRTPWIVVLFVLSISLPGCGTPSARPPGDSTDWYLSKRVVPPRFLMRGLVAQHFESLRNGLQAGVKTRAEWENVAMSASLLHEASYSLMRASPGPDSSWQVATSGMLRDGSRGIIDAYRERDVEAARRAFERMREACATCHRECPADLARVGVDSR